MKQRAWTLPRSSVLFAALSCLALSTQLLFQRALYQEWPAVDIALAWARGFCELTFIAVAILAALILAARIPLQNFIAQCVLFGVALFAGALFGEWAVLGIFWGAWPTIEFSAVATRAIRWLPIGFFAGAIVVFRQRTLGTAAQLHETQVRRLQLEQQHVAIRLQLLQAQIEPHFLFNTLATIRRLHQTDLQRGRETLAHFIHYLKSSLPEMRARETTLGREVDLIGAYLDVLRVRMGSRLEFSIEVDTVLRDLLIPPLSLATLVENAIKHGISNLPEGGAIAINAWLEDDTLSVRVADTGAGLVASSGTGVGLANLRVRLRGLYGEAGVLAIAANHPQGLTATIHVPAARLATEAIGHAN